MQNYIIFTDSGCDISQEMLADWGVPYRCLTFKFNNDEKEYSNEDMDVVTFYDRMRKGGVAKTSAVNSEVFSIAFEEILKEGKDLLYLGFSSGLSATYNSARLAADSLRDKYPDRKIVVIDTLCASAGLGLVVYLALQKQKNGATIEEVAEYVESIKLNVCHWVTVDDLVYLKRGGRVSPTTAFVGNVLGIKPIVKVDNDGKLDSCAKAKGRKASINYLADRYGEMANSLDGTVFISHADCEDEARLLGDILKDRYNANIGVITYIGPVVGAHAGPGTIALFFVGSSRDN